jgi:LysR family positive regulator for ilvC
MCCSVTASYTIFDKVLSIFRKKYPQIRIKLTTSNSEDSLHKILNGNVDISIAIQPVKRFKNLIQREITVSPIRFIAAKKPLFNPDCIKSNGISWNEVPFIMPKEGESRKRLERWFRKKEIKPNIYAEVSGNEAVFGLISMGLGIGVVSDLFLNNNSQKDKIRILQVKPDLKPYIIVMCTSKRGFQSPLVQAFWNETNISI